MRGNARGRAAAPPAAEPRRLGRAALAAALVVLGGLASPGPASPAPARPDAALFRQAEQARATLRGSTRRQARRLEWESVILRYRRLVARYPRSAYCDDALLAVGDLYRDMARRFKARTYEDDAVQAYRTLVAEYPSSSRGEPALFAVFEIARARGDRQRLSEAASTYLEAFPDGPHQAEVGAALRRTDQARAASLPAAPRGLAQVYDLRFWSGPSSTRIVVDLGKQVAFKFDRLSDPDRLWIDLDRTRLHPNLKGRVFPVGDGLLEQVRVAQNRPDTVRVVLDFKQVQDHTIFYLPDPLRLVVDVRGQSPPDRAEAKPPAGAAPSPAPARLAEARPPIPSPPEGREIEPPDLPPEPSPAPARGEASGTASPAPSPGTAPAEGSAPSPPAPVPDEVQPLPPRRVAAVSPPSPTPRPRPSPVVVTWTPPRQDGGRGTPGRAAASAEAPSAAPETRQAAPRKPAAAARVERRPQPLPTPPQPPQANSTGGYSLARQLGLGARRIVVDAGHGGHDPGAIGRGGLQEKDVVLDVARILAGLLEEELGVEVVMTRSDDVFIPLEERTAIANSAGADLFLSIHANASRNTAASGIETYYLNFAVDRHAEAVAARENAISAATLKDLQNLVKAIALNSKINESRDFAAAIQKGMAARLRPRNPHLNDRGVHTAPLYVLIGANMPSILAEIAFVSHPEEERLLKDPAYRLQVAQSLLEGVRRYLESLDRNSPRQLTAAGPARTGRTRSPEPRAAGARAAEPRSTGTRVTAPRSSGPRSSAPRERR